MCPLRIILLFLSATLAGFFVLKNLKSQSQSQSLTDDESPKDSFSSSSPLSCKDKVKSAIAWGFWTFVDMASGRYLWRHFAAAAAANTCD